MTEQEAKQCILLDEAWMSVEKQTEALIYLADTQETFGLSREGDTLVRGVCSLVAMECKRRRRERKIN